LAPEVYDEKYDEKVDIYAFGMVILSSFSDFIKNTYKGLKLLK
jgi:serine/threonine protein kinase